MSHEPEGYEEWARDMLESDAREKEWVRGLAKRDAAEGNTEPIDRDELRKSLRASIAARLKGKG